MSVPTPSPLTDLQLAQLARLAEIGMEIAEAAGLQARRSGEGEPAGADPALSFARAARAVRLTIALQARLVAERTAAERADGAARASEAGRRRHRIHAKVERALEQVAEVEGEHADADAVEHLSSAAWEKLIETEDEEILGRPIEEVVARICADLSLPSNWAASAFDVPLCGRIVQAGAELGASAPDFRPTAGMDRTPAVFRDGSPFAPEPALPGSTGPPAPDGPSRPP